MKAVVAGVEGIDSIVKSFGYDVIHLRKCDGLYTLSMSKIQDITLFVLDIFMKGIDGLQILRHIHLDHPEAIVIIVADEEASCLILEAIKYGARGFISRDSLQDNLFEVIEGLTGCETNKLSLEQS